MTKKVAQLASVIMLLSFCQNPAISQQQSTGRSSVLGGSTASQPSDVIPPDFRGEITYTGTYSGSVKTKADRMRSLSLNEALRSATSSQTLPLSGEYQLTVRYEGNRIYGAFVSRSATGPNGASIDPRGSFVGTRNGTTCTFTSEQVRGGPPTVGYCGRSRWEWGSDDVFNPQGHKVALRIVTKQTGMVDFGERERLAVSSGNLARGSAVANSGSSGSNGTSITQGARATSTQGEVVDLSLWLGQNTANTEIGGKDFFAVAGYDRRSIIAMANIPERYISFRAPFEMKFSPRGTNNWHYIIFPFCDSRNKVCEDNAVVTNVVIHAVRINTYYTATKLDVSNNRFCKIQASSRNCVDTIWGEWRSGYWSYQNFSGFARGDFVESVERWANYTQEELAAKRQGSGSGWIGDPNSEYQKERARCKELQENAGGVVC